MNDDVCRMVEAIASWRSGIPQARALLEESAVDLVVAGDQHTSIAELAGLRPDESPWVVDGLLERVVDDLQLHQPLSGDPQLLVIRSLCRSVLAGTADERELASQAHRVFQHRSDSNLMNELALLEDDFDDAVWPDTDLEPYKARVREIAAQVLRAGQE